MTKKVLVTGSDGFIGSHLVEALLNRSGYEVKAFVFYNSFNSLGWLDAIDKGKLSKAQIISGDIRDESIVRAAVNGVDVVFHLAALIGIPFSYSSPASYIETNIKGTLNILQACRDFRAKKVLITSTSEVYGTAKYTPIDERHPRQGQSPYSASKIGADHLAESFYRSFGLPAVIVRPFNTYGPRQSGRAVIPSIITQLVSGNTRIKLGSLHPTRDFVFIKDTVEGFIETAESDKVIGEEINIATQSEISIKEIAEKLIGMINPDAKVVRDAKRLRPAKSEVERLIGSNEKIMKLTDWKPRVSLDEGLRETVEWFKDPKNLERYKVNNYNV
jgi:NAD dependent epimerase/dehydratase